MTPTAEQEFITLWQQGLSHDAMAERLGWPVGTIKSRAHRLQQQGVIQPRPRGRAMAQPTAVHPSTPASGEWYTAAHSGTPARRHTRVHRGTPNLPDHQPTAVHPGTPLPNEAALRLLSLLPDLEVMVARERDRQRLLSTPVGTPRHTLKKTYVVDTLYVDLIERYAQAEGVERKDVVNLAFHEFFERRDYLPGEA
jgi:DNA-binding transcriptional MocR family regulator